MRRCPECVDLRDEMCGAQSDDDCTLYASCPFDFDAGACNHTAESASADDRHHERAYDLDADLSESRWEK